MKTGNLKQTSLMEPRGFIQPHELRELWFHTGTACNLACPFCLEGSKPGDDRLQRITLEDVQPVMEEAVSLGVQQFSFTGGEPFVVKEFVKILNHASSLKPSLVLSNGTGALPKRLHQLIPLLDNPHSVSFRISIDWPDEERHDALRGAGSFKEALASVVKLQQLGFETSVARQRDPNEDSENVDLKFEHILSSAGAGKNVRIVSFPDFLLPGSEANVPEITENCMVSHHDETSRAQFMCAFSKMVVKRNNQLFVFACTLVDDDEHYNQGQSLSKAMTQRVFLKHHRCYSCFALGASCSET